ncbi:MAG TPA: ABC transporter permease [Conexibacter sp.]|nr:ABC transporter permease [Conexibacter sp.]
MSAHAAGGGDELPVGGLRARFLATGLRRSGPRRRGYMLQAGFTIVALLLLASLIGHFVLPKPNVQDLQAPLQSPSGSHLFGTDDLGRDVLSRTLAATWLDLALGIGVTTVSITVGVLLGTLAGFTGGWFERLVMRLTDLVIAFPFMVLVIAIIAILGPGVTGVYVALVSVGWPFYARFARAEMLSLRERQFIQAARTLGFSNRRVMLRHALPSVLRPTVVYAMSDIVLNILFIASLSFLGLGVRPPQPEWGSVIAEGQSYLLTAWWISTLPGILLVIVGIGFTLIGDGLAERLGARREYVLP